MTRDRGEWQYLLNYKSVEKRAELDRNDCLDDADLLINDMRIKLDDLMMLLAVEGQKEADMYWRMSEGHRDEKPDAEECRIGTRVRVVGVSLVLSPTGCKPGCSLAAL